MTRGTTLPLGVDVGSARTRVALVERGPGGAPRLLAVAARPTADDPARAIAAARAELGCGERRCVLALGPADAVVRATAFPAMRRRERERAARFEAARFAPCEPHEAALRVAALDGRRCVVAVARRAALERRVHAARRAGLRPVAVDDVAFALVRAFPNASAIVDVGENATVLVVARDPIPSVRSFPVGGRTFTGEVAGAFGIDERDAERRKCGIGIGGAGGGARERLVAGLAASLLEERESARADVRSIVLCGNGARVAGLAEALERATAVPVRLGTLAPHASAALPADVLRAASPDWAVAYGLALWELAA